jgi:hypothetical protein
MYWARSQALLMGYTSLLAHKMASAAAGTVPLGKSRKNLVHNRLTRQVEPHFLIRFGPEQTTHAFYSI